MKKVLFFAVVALVAASCADDKFIGDVANPQDNSPSESNAIVFNSGARGVTRADHFGADAAGMLSNHFTVGGFKGDGSTRTTVFDNYIVNWVNNTAGTTESNTSDWEYVGITAALPSSITGAQTIKFWDYSTSQYDFVAYSTGALSATTSAPTAGTNIQVTAIDKDNLTTAAYTLTGAARADLAGCYIADMVTAYDTNDPSTTEYGKEVTLTFRNLASKVRMALYETVPGYSVKDVKFYTTAVNSGHLGQSGSGSTWAATTGTAALIGTMNETGTYTVFFPTIGSSNQTNSDYNKAHVTFAVATTSDYQTYGALTSQYVAKESREKSAGNIWLGRTSTTATFAGTSPFYQVVLPNENGAVFELAIDYTLEATDGSGEEIKVYGATAFIPAVYTKWLPNYAYTYIFKISDNTNGWTSTTNTDPKGLFPITFDAVVIDSEEHTQTTITTVAEPSITTYQKGHVYDASDEYKVPTNAEATAAANNDAIYAQVMKDGALVTDLATTNSYFYTISNHGKTYTAQPTGWPTGYYTDAACTTEATGTFSNSTTYYKRITEADVMDALNIRTSGTDQTVVGRNGITLTPSTDNYAATQIPGEDGNWITKYNDGTSTPATIAAGMVAKLSPDAAGTYAFVYDYTDLSGVGPAVDYVYTAVQLATKPSDFTTKYYKKKGPGQDPTSFQLCVDADFVANGYFYTRYEDKNHTYAVKVIKVQ